MKPFWSKLVVNCAIVFVLVVIVVMLCLSLVGLSFAGQWACHTFGLPRDLAIIPPLAAVVVYVGFVITMLERKS